MTRTGVPELTFLTRWRKSPSGRPSHAAAAQAPQRAHRAGDHPRGRADLAGRDLAPGRHLEADRLARAPVAGRRGARARGGDGPSGPSYGAVFFEPVPEAAFVLGLDLGARFLRGAVCDLAGEIRARQDVELRGADADGALQAIAALRASLVAAAALPVERIDGVVLGVPGVVDARRRRCTSRPRTSRASKAARFGAELAEPLGSTSRSRTTSTLRLSVSAGPASPAASTTSRFSPSAPAWAWASSSAANCTAAITARPARWTGHSPASAEDVDPSADGVAALAERVAPAGSAGTSLAPPYDARAIFAAARRGDPLGRDGGRGGRSTHRGAHRADRRGRRSRARRARRRARHER